MDSDPIHVRHTRFRETVIELVSKKIEIEYKPSSHDSPRMLWRTRKREKKLRGSYGLVRYLDCPYIGRDIRRVDMVRSKVIDRPRQDRLVSVPKHSKAFLKPNMFYDSKVSPILLKKMVHSLDWFIHEMHAICKVSFRNEITIIIHGTWNGANLRLCNQTPNGEVLIHWVIPPEILSKDRKAPVTLRMSAEKTISASHQNRSRIRNMVQRSAPKDYNVKNGHWEVHEEERTERVRICAWSLWSVDRRVVDVIMMMKSAMIVRRLMGLSTYQVTSRSHVECSVNSSLHSEALKEACWKPFRRLLEACFFRYARRR